MPAKREIKGHCILCHRDNQIMSDEHVIPEAIGGYLHIDTICKECNSKLGANVDKLLIDNWLITTARYKYHLKGHSRNVPHPFVGEGVLESGEKVRMEIDEYGRLITHMIPSAPQYSADGKHVSFAVDSKDIKSIEHIKEAILKRKKRDGKKYITESSIEERKIDKPCVTMRTSIDIKNYLLALLKIAYEFTITQCPAYEEDLKAKQYAKILIDADTKRIDKISILSNHFLDHNFKIFEPCIDNNEYRHILLLTEIKNQLVCIVKIFDIFGVYIIMSDSSYGKGGTNGVIAINDYKYRRCDVYTVDEIFRKTIRIDSAGNIQYVKI